MLSKWRIKSNCPSWKIQLSKTQSNWWIVVRLKITNYPPVQFQAIGNSSLKHCPSHIITITAAAAMSFWKFQLLFLRILGSNYSMLMILRNIRVHISININLLASLQRLDAQHIIYKTGVQKCSDDYRSAWFLLLYLYQIDPPYFLYLYLYRRNHGAELRSHLELLESIENDSKVRKAL